MFSQTAAYLRANCCYEMLFINVFGDTGHAVSTSRQVKMAKDRCQK